MVRRSSSSFSYQITLPNLDSLVLYILQMLADTQSINFNPKFLVMTVKSCFYIIEIDFLFLKKNLTFLNSV